MSCRSEEDDDDIVENSDIALSIIKQLIHYQHLILCVTTLSQYLEFVAR